MHYSYNKNGRGFASPPQVLEAICSSINIQNTRSPSYVCQTICTNLNLLDESLCNKKQLPNLKKTSLSQDFLFCHTEREGERERICVSASKSERERERCSSSCYLRSRFIFQLVIFQFRSAFLYNLKIQ